MLERKTFWRDLCKNWFDVVEGAGLVTCPAAHKQETIKMFWLHFRALTSSIFLQLDTIHFTSTTARQQRLWGHSQTRWTCDEPTLNSFGSDCAERLTDRRPLKHAAFIQVSGSWARLSVCVQTSWPCAAATLTTWRDCELFYLCDLMLEVV